ncbi:hypothetical protein NLG97_g8113 [Lecanicillium saksenae]|uniref:Uncharacterized protein n=1 Tax=Lecanicillium saksenae TaxID=468837 RepID=A0ACC1QLL2_9HYPO|nr:hypothetical protein NLG97_g8113 [Lecanicillium saksenae]
MNTVKSFWLGWGSVCVAGAGAYYFAKREINADRQAKLEAHRQKRHDIRSMEYGVPHASGGASKPDYAGSPSAESSNDPAPGGQDLGIESGPKREKEDASPYESRAIMPSLPHHAEALPPRPLLVISYAHQRELPQTSSSTTFHHLILSPSHCSSAIMASPELAIARAALSASLFKADPTSLSRQQVDSLFPLVDATVAQCSRQNVQHRAVHGLSVTRSLNIIAHHPQSCKNWIMAHVASSPARCANLAKYLAALSRSVQPDASARPSLKRKRLHILYLISDALHHDARTGNRICANAWAPHLVALVALAASFDKCPKHQAKLVDLVSLWEEERYFTVDIIPKLRDAVMNNGNITAGAAESDASATLFHAVV